MSKMARKNSLTNSSISPDRKNGDSYSQAGHIFVLPLSCIDFT